MLVYGDDRETVRPRLLLGEIEEALGRLDGRRRGLEWHAAAVEAFIRLAGLAQAGRIGSSTGAATRPARRRRTGCTMR